MTVCIHRRHDSIRIAILKTAVDLPEENRIMNIEKWGQDANVVLTAVMESDLVAIVDLGQIKNHRMMVMALEAFRQIMSKGAPPVLMQGMQVEQISNPLLPGKVPEEMQGDKMIAADQTIFA